MSDWKDKCPADLLRALEYVHPSWKAAVEEGLRAVHLATPDYFAGLKEGGYLPDQARLFAAFSLPMESVRYILIGEGPYPRANSATGYCFMDGAVGDLWSDEEGGGLSKKVNRATSLRNFMKMLLVASGDLQVDATTGNAIAGVSMQARQTDSGFIRTLADLQNNLTRQGFLLLNASLVFRSDVAPAKDAKAWLPFLQAVLLALTKYQDGYKKPQVMLVLWGKIAEQLRQVPAVSAYQQICAEHPYNLSFIANQSMQDFFRPMHLLSKIS
ncbi:uracil-DNA glycosylase [Undibacterium sp. TJN19]|uniref:uracil-DNA glycosylase family protein n=1 Tax=Undibacterium sp. TJN19 TaxID=3413055 RepID=UPI003BEF65B2